MVEGSKVRIVRGLDGLPICINDLPEGNDIRWNKKRKIIVACAVKGGILSEEDAASRYQLGEDELPRWMAMISGSHYAGMPVRQARTI